MKDYNLLKRIGEKGIKLDRLKNIEDDLIKQDIFNRVFGDNEMSKLLFDKFMNDNDQDAISFLNDLDSDNFEKFILNY